MAEEGDGGGRGGGDEDGNGDGEGEERRNGYLSGLSTEKKGQSFSFV